MKRIVLLISALSLLILPSCIDIRVNLESAKGDVVERTLSISEDITAVAVTNGITAIVDHTLPRGEVRVLTHSDVQDMVVVETKGSTLNLKMRASAIDIKVLEIRIPAYDFDSVATAGGSDFEWEGCTAETLNVAASSGSDLEIKGSCKVLNAAASSGADLDLEELIAESVTIAVSSGADAHVYTTRELIANATGGAEITYSGNPTSREINASTSATISRD